jgi:serine/threonine protein kinase
MDIERAREMYQAKIGSGWQITRALGSGAGGCGYLIENAQGERRVLKVPGKTKGTGQAGVQDYREGWLERQAEGYEIIEKHFGDFHGNLEIPKILQAEEDFVIEQYLGESMNVWRGESIPANLSDEQKSQLAKDLAHFLRFCHEKKAEGDIVDLKTESKSHKITEECLEWLKPALSRRDYYKAQTMLKNFRTRNKSDERRVLSHGDIGFHNMLYDERTGKFALIDFEYANEGRNKYRDFHPGSLTYNDGDNNPQFDIFWGVVREYNKSAKVPVDAEKMRIGQELSLIQRSVFASMRGIDDKTPEQVAEVLGKSLRGANRTYNEVYLGQTHSASLPGAQCIGEKPEESYGK